MKKIDFTKMVATGNDFIAIDARKPDFNTMLSTLAKRLCHRRTGIGADGLLVVETSKTADFKMRIFNPDGSEPDMCGNGSRCIALYAKQQGIARASMSIETKAGLLSARVSGNKVKINMTDPKGINLDMKLRLKDKTYRLHYINTGVPHAVYYVNNLHTIDLDCFGKAVRYHKMFMPEGVNVNIVKAGNNSSLTIRTYERGVEAETLACGTGAAASALISSCLKKFKSPVRVRAKGGDLTIYFKREKNIFHDVFLEGEAKTVFTGSMHLQ
jgi:diaminopimelate epimerase